MASNLADIIETKSRLEILEERFDRHLVKIDKDILKLFDKIDKLSDSNNQNRIDQIKDDRDTRIKIYTMAGIISIFISGITTLIDFIKN